jgi:hypothetical protein
MKTVFQFRPRIGEDLLKWLTGRAKNPRRLFNAPSNTLGPIIRRTPDKLRVNQDFESKWLDLYTGESHSKQDCWPVIRRNQEKRPFERGFDF